MNKVDEDAFQLIENLKERQKELNCIHGLEGILTDFDSPLENIFDQILQILPSGWQFQDRCFAEIEYQERIFKVSPHENTIYMQKAPLHKNNIILGEIRIYYTDVPPELHHDPFVKEEYSLLQTVASILASYLAVRSYKENMNEPVHRSEWKVIINLLQKTDIKLFLRIARKLLNLLYQKGIDAAISIYESFGNKTQNSPLDLSHEVNSPLKKQDYRDTLKLSNQIFDIAEQHFSEDELIDFIRKWMQEAKLNSLTISLENPDSTLAVIQDEVSRIHNQDIHQDSFSPYAYLNAKVLMIQKLFTNQLQFINVAKNYIELDDFYEVLQHTIFPATSHGKLGGKSTGLFFADNIIHREGDPELCRHLKTPQTWYITSDAMLNFLHYNNLEEVVEQKYKDIEIVRAEYGNIIQMFKNSQLPQEISKGLSQLLDEMEHRPIIVRSSSLLEDSFGAAFSGKYKSLFLANQGSKKERLNALEDAIAEVYASIVGPDPIQYRKERGLLDFQEEMAIMIQEVVGTKCGKYFFPAFAGVAFSNNEFRWSSRISKEDGLVRMVPGLGTRAVDRLSDDYPVLASPGKPGIRVNASTDEILRYCPKNIDLINLETNSFESRPLLDIIRECRDDYPLYQQLFSVYENDYIAEKSGFNIDFSSDDLIVTFNGLIRHTDFLKKMKKILDILGEKLHTPVDIEFAVKDDNIYLLQCRPQNFASVDEPQPIPQDIPSQNILFTAHKYISNGYIPEISYIVYVDPDNYSKLSGIEDLRRVGRCVGKLNSL
nr:PEP/pyruvate-binding domain-containing protein [Candidatus Cloacimonadota bacterium]